MISRLKSWALTAFAVLSVLVGAYLAGGRAARRSVEIDQARRETKSREVARNVDSKIDAMGNDDVRAAASKWVRGK